MATCCKEGHHQGACTQICLSWGTMENKQWFKGHLYYMKEMHLLTKEHLPNGRHRDSEEQLKLSLGSVCHRLPFLQSQLTLMAQVQNTVQALNWPANAAAVPPQLRPISAPGILPSQLSHSAHQNLTVPIQVPVVLPR